MSKSEKDKKLSQLFQLKWIEVPSEEFWKKFEMGLERKFLQQMGSAKRGRISPMDWFRILFRKYKIYLTSFSDGACVLALVLACCIYPGKWTVQLKDSVLLFSGEVLSLQRTGEDATLTFRMPEVQYSNYVRDDIYTSGLNSRGKELTF
jgi:hypothetical protein